jgi:hypothetical protein
MRAVVAAFVLMLVAATAAADPLPSPVVLPKQQLPLHFSHARHLKLPEVGCGTCHEGAAGSVRASDNLIPTEASCTTCHEVDRAQPTKQADPPARCDACHAGFSGGPVARVVVPTPNLKFNHKVHIQKNMRCTFCHGDLAAQNVDLATRAQLPRMPLCLQCHDGQTAPSACTTCHIAGRQDRIQTRFPEGTLTPSGVLRGDAHDLRFRLDHAAVARQDDRYCANCHARSECLDCHNGVTKPLDFHAGDYIALHPVDARRGTTDCQACHRLQTFCTGCHARTGVSADPKTSEFERLSRDESATHRFHPEGWWTTMTKGLRMSGHHSFQAERNIRTCASCHREEFCLECHRQQVDPHPAGWRGSSRCKALLARSGRMCLRCHTQVEDVQCD